MLRAVFCDGSAMFVSVSTVDVFYSRSIYFFMSYAMEGTLVLYITLVHLLNVHVNISIFEYSILYNCIP